MGTPFDPSKGEYIPTRKIMKQLRLLASLFALTLTTAITSAQSSFVGSDEFDDNVISDHWVYSTNDNGATSVSESGGRLIFTFSGNDNGYHGWIEPSANDFTWSNDWVIETTLSNDTELGVGESWGGLGLFNNNAGNGMLNNYFGIYLSRNASGGFVETWFGSQGESEYSAAQTATLSVDSTTDVQLALLWVASAGTLYGLYAPAGTSNYDTIYTFAPFGAHAGLDPYQSNSFGVELAVGVDNDAAFFNPAISFDSFNAQSLSAVPEPSSYAALAGACVLGAVMTRRRRSPAKGVKRKI